MPSSTGKDAKKPTPTVASTKRRLMDGGTAVDACEFVVHYMVKNALHQYKQRFGRSPKLLYIPKSIEAAIVIDLGRSEDRHDVSLRKNGLAQEMFGCPVVWDADEFRIDY
jgi:hypothetical protein